MALASSQNGRKAIRPMPENQIERLLLGNSGATTNGRNGVGSCLSLFVYPVGKRVWALDGKILGTLDFTGFEKAGFSRASKPLSAPISTCANLILGIYSYIVELLARRTGRPYLRNIPMTAAAKISPADVMEQASVILFGRDGAKARASWFGSDEMERAKKAAKLMDMNFISIGNDDVRQLATKMPKGRLFDSGKAFVPFVQGAVCDQLVAHLPKGQKLRVRMATSTKEAAADTTKESNNVAPPHYPKDWGDIKVGSLVLASESEDDGWWPCIVQEVYSKELRLKWRDYPDYDVVTRGYDQVALMWAAPTQAAVN